MAPNYRLLYYYLCIEVGILFVLVDQPLEAMLPTAYAGMIVLCVLFFSPVGASNRIVPVILL